MDYKIVEEIFVRESRKYPALKGKWKLGEVALPIILAAGKAELEGSLELRTLRPI